MRKALIPIVGLVALALVGCTTGRSDSDEAMLGYNSGPFQATSYDACYDPGSIAYDGPNDQHFNYPTGQRTYKFAGDGNDVDGPAISVVSDDNIEMKLEGVVTFTTTFSCAEGPDGKTNLQKFHEEIGLKYRKQYGDAWWDQMMDTYIKGPSDRAADRAAQEFNWADLYNSPATKARFETRIAELAPNLMGTQAGGEYFRILSVAIQKPDPPQNLKDALKAKEQAVIDNETQLKKNATIATELESIEDLVGVLGVQGYVNYAQIKIIAQAIADGKVTVIPVPQGGNVIVSPAR